MNFSADPMNREQIMNMVRDSLYAFGDLKVLAARTGISYGCLQAIRVGKTAWPRPVTLWTIMPHLGLALIMVRVGAVQIPNVTKLNVVPRQQDTLAS